MSEKLINEEFKIWKKTSPLLYDLIYTYSLPWPSLTAQWLKKYETAKCGADDVIRAQFLLGTHTTGGEQNYLRLYDVDLPPTLESDKYGEYPVSNLTADANTTQQRLHLAHQWKHPGEVNKVRIDEQLGLIATQTGTGDVLIFNQHSDDQSTLKFHKSEGFGLEWSPYRPGYLLSANEDCNIALWDLADKPQEKPAKTYSTHNGIVNDVTWLSADLFASGSDDGSYQVHDLRSDKVVIEVAHAHDGSSINAIESHPTVTSLLATGSSDTFVKSWDLRDYSKPLRQLYGHTGPIINLKFNNNLLLSSSVDRSVLIWDLEKISDGEFDVKEYEKKDSDYTDPCLVFKHGGHTGKLCEADWHPALENVVLSTAEDGLTEIWRPLGIDESSETDTE